MEKDLKKLFDDYIGEHRFARRLRLETIRGYNNVFDLFLKLMPEVKETDDLSESVCKNFFKIIQERERVVGRSKIVSGVKNSTIKTQMAKLNVFFKWLKLKNYIKENPLKDIKKPSVRYVDFRRVDDNDIHKLYSSVVLNPINNLLSARDNMMISLLINCGLRKGEFISLRVDDVDLINKEITVRGETSKSNFTRRLPLNSTLITHIKEYFKERQKKGLKTEALIVSNKGDYGLSREGLKHWVQSLNKKSGVKFHLHMFRHTFACKLSEQDVNLFKIQKLLGHTDIRMTMQYARSLRTEDMRQDVEKISF